MLLLSPFPLPHLESQPTLVRGDLGGVLCLPPSPGTLDTARKTNKNPMIRFCGSEMLSSKVKQKKRTGNQKDSSSIVLVINSEKMLGQTPNKLRDP